MLKNTRFFYVMASMCCCLPPAVHAVERNVTAMKGTQSDARYYAAATTCGDGILDPGEACDDGNVANGDGCSSSCTVESGYTCDTSQPSVCTDIDECALGLDNCDIVSTCTNTPGSFFCTCNAGYVDTGVICGAPAYYEKKTAWDPMPDDEFGVPSVFSDLAVVGSRWDDDNGAESGSAYTFEWLGTMWVQAQKLLAADGAAGDEFGSAVYLSEQNVIIGAPQTNVGATGAAYVFQRSGGIWSQQAKLTAFDAAAGDTFGYSVAMSRDVAIVGALYDDSGTGSAYVYRLVAGVWTFEQKLTASDGVAGDEFGVSVAVDGDAAVVGARYARQPSLLMDGAAYVFRYNAGVWSQERKFVAPDGISDGQFGAAVGIASDVAVVAAQNDDDNGTRSGSVYVFRTDGTLWVLEQKLLASDGTAEDQFGTSVAIDAGSILVGAVHHTGAAPDSGAAYLFRWNTTSWVEDQILAVGDGDTGDAFGGVVSLNGDVAFVSAVADDDHGNNSGAAYAFVLCMTCADIDECALGTDNCDVNATCTNIPGSFTCTCNSGYAGNGLTCTDIDECTLGTHSCDPNATCFNTPGSYDCTCNAGFAGDGFTCTDIDECALGTDACDVNATCANTVGSYDCTCNAGYQGDGFTCADVDECTLGTHDCDPNATCFNTVGSYDCTCNAGYAGDGFTCTDIDECALGTDNCDVNATCTNTGGGFDCTCNLGYEGDGVTCTLIVPAPPDPLIPLIRTNRYLRFWASPFPGANEEVIRVRIVSLNGFPIPPTDTFYVGPPFDAHEEDSSQPGLTFRAAPLQCDPYVHDWLGEASVAAYGAEIIPDSVYAVQRAAAFCPDLATNEACWSGSLLIATAKFGDVAPLYDGDDPGAPQPDFNDIAGMVNKFLAAPGAPLKAVCQLQPNVVFPGRAIDFRDIAADVNAFVGTPTYVESFFGPCACPSSVTCGVTPCTNDLVCGTGLCVSGFCRDECGRCTP